MQNKIFLTATFLSQQVLSSSVSQELQVWSPDQTYESGDLVTVDLLPDFVFKCKSEPFSDFCKFSPTSHAGLSAWEKLTEDQLQSDNLNDDMHRPMPEVSCRAYGRFQKDDYFCDDSKYVWRCRNNENCDVLRPSTEEKSLDYWKMWETWELVRATPVMEQGQKEIGQMIDIMNRQALDDGYSTQVGPIVLAISIEQFWDAFLDNKAPYFFDSLYRYLGTEVLSTTDWTQLPGQHVQTRTLRTEVPTGMKLIKTAKSEIEMTLIEKSATSIKIGLEFKASRGQKLISGITYYEEWEVLSDGPEAQQVAMRMSNRIEWHRKPPGVWKYIQSSATNRVDRDKPLYEEWFPKRANEYSDSIRENGEQKLVNQNDLIGDKLETTQTITQTENNSKQDEEERLVFEDEKFWQFASLDIFTMLYYSCFAFGILFSITLAFKVAQKCARVVDNNNNQNGPLPPSEINYLLFDSDALNPKEDWNSTI